MRPLRARWGGVQQRIVVLDARPTHDGDLWLVVGEDGRLYWSRGPIEVDGVLADDGTALRRWLRDGQA